MVIGHSCTKMLYKKFLEKIGLLLVSNDMCSVALHPEKQILATASDDRTWKLWGLPNGELILTGHGHSDWVAGCDFHPSYVVFTTVFSCSTLYCISVGFARKDPASAFLQLLVWETLKGLYLSGMRKASDI